MKIVSLVAAGMLLSLPMPALAQDSSLAFGGDQYAAGQNITLANAVERDAFVAGNDVTLSAPVTGDAHLAGFDVNAAAPVTGDIYAFGFSVDVTAAVGGDVTAAGNTVSLRSSEPIAGNARLAGANVTVATAVNGAALITADTLTLDAPINGDLSFYGKTITFGPAAKVNGTFSIQAPNAIAVPESVAAADRVSFTQFTSPDYMTEAGRTAAETVVTRFWPGFWMAVATLLAVLLVGAAFIALMPRGLAKMQTLSERRPFRNFGLGMLAFASLLGLIPVLLLTVIGILAIPFVLVFVLAGCFLGYLAGVYLAGMRLATAFARIDTNLKRVAVLAVALVAAALLGIVPVLGWLFTLLLLVFGLGVIAVALMVRWTRKDAARLEAIGPAAVAATPAE